MFSLTGGKSQTGRQGGVVVVVEGGGGDFFFRGEKMRRG